MTCSKRWFVAALPLAAVLAACGGTPTSGSDGQDSASGTETASVYERLNALPADEAREEAVRLAQEEGELSVYAATKEDVMRQFTEAFSEEFDIPVELFRGSTEVVLQRVVQEQSAGRLGADVVENAFAEQAALNDAGILADYEGSCLDDVSDEAKSYEGWTAWSTNLFVPVWNTNIIKAGDEPRAWEDLADPRFNGQTTIEVADADWFANLSLYWAEQGKSQEEIDELWDQIADGAAVSSGHNAMIQLLAAGQSGINAMNYKFLADLAIEKGAPIGYRSEDGKVHAPAFAQPFGLSLPKDAENPAAAWLFYDWMLCEGQDMVAPVASLVPVDKEASQEVLKGITVVPFATEELIENGQMWDDKFDALLRGLPKIGG